MSIVVKEVTKKYGEQLALNKVSFHCKPGEIVGFLGPNGAGKSTMMKILSCFIPPTSGTASVGGIDVIENPLEAKRQFGYLPELNPLYKEMYVKEYLLFVAGLHQIENTKQRIDELIDLVGLGLERHKKIEMLSKGYKQRVGLAQALMHNPKVLILDEATTGLDPNQIFEIRELIKKLGEEKTVLLSTHIMQEVEAVCDRVIIINKGNIVADEPVEILKKHNEGNQVITVEFSELPNIEQLKQFDGIVKINIIADNQIEIISDYNKDLRNDIFQFAVSKGISVLGLQKQERKLEDIFKELTK